MVTVGCHNPSLLSRPTRPVPLPHDPGHFLLSDYPSLTLKLFGNPSIPIGTELQAYITNSIYQRLITGRGLRFTVEASSRQLDQFTPPLNPLDKSAIFGNELCLSWVCLRLFITAFLGIRFQA